MANELGGKAAAAFQDIARVMDEWSHAVGERVKANLDDVQAKNDLSPTDLTRWSVEAVQFFFDGAKRMAEGLLDGVAHFDASPSPPLTAPGVDEAEHATKLFDITNNGPVPSPLTLILTGLRTGSALESSKVTVEPNIVPRGTCTVTVTVDVTGLDDVYIGRLTGGPSITPQPGMTFGHRVV